MLFGAIALIAIGAILPTLAPTGFNQSQLQVNLSGFNQSQLQGNLSSGQIPLSPELSPVPLSLIGGIGIAIGGVLLAIAIAYLVVAYGLLKGFGWSWTFAVILSIISIVLNAVSVAVGNFYSIISIIISGLILYYLYRPHVKAFFGKGVSGYTAAA